MFVWRILFVLNNQWEMWVERQIYNIWYASCILIYSLLAKQLGQSCGKNWLFLFFSIHSFSSNVKSLIKTKVSADDLSGLCVTRGIKVFLWSVNASKAKDIRFIPYYKRGVKSKYISVKISVYFCSNEIWTETKQRRKM